MMTYSLFPSRVYPEKQTVTKHVDTETARDENTLLWRQLVMKTRWYGDSSWWKYWMKMASLTTTISRDLFQHLIECWGIISQLFVANEWKRLFVFTRQFIIRCYFYSKRICNEFFFCRNRKRSFLFVLCEGTIVLRYCNAWNIRVPNFATKKWKFHFAKKRQSFLFV
jgi:hypothetical protein